MAFVKLQPAAKVAPGSFRISTIQLGRGENKPWRMQVSIPSAEFHLTFGTAERFDILLGDGPDAGKMLIQPGEGGAFKPTRLKSAVIFRLPASETTPQIKFDGENPARRKTPDGLVIDLPSWAWEPGRWEAIRDARAIAQRQEGAERLTRRGVLDQVGRFKP